MVVVQRRDETKFQNQFDINFPRRPASVHNFLPVTVVVERASADNHRHRRSSLKSTTTVVSEDFHRSLEDARDRTNREFGVLWLIIRSSWGEGS